MAVPYIFATAVSTIPLANLDSNFAYFTNAMTVTGTAVNFLGNVGYTGTLTGGTGVVNLGSGQFYKDASGNIGIGTASPLTKLNVESGDFLLRGGLITVGPTAGGNGAFQLQGALSGVQGSLIIKTQNSSAVQTEVMRIDSSGNCGIGTSSPATRLQIESSASNTRAKVVSALSGSLYYSGIEFSRTSTLGGALIETARNATYGGVGLAFSTTADNAAETAGTYTERMRIDSSGNVGIGLTNPSRKLDVSGTGTVFSAVTSTNGVAVFSAYSASGSDVGYLLNAGGVETARITSPAGAAVMAFGTGASAIERMRIDSSGNVGIGLSSPIYKLDISNSLNGTSIARLLNNNAGASASCAFFADNGGAAVQYGVAGANYSGYGAASANNGWIYTAQDMVIMVDNPSKSLKFAVGGNAEKMRIDSSGNLLIGQSSHIWGSAGRGDLEINGSSSSILALNTGGVSTNSSYLYNDAAALDITVANSRVMKFSTNGAERMRIDSSGNLLVGRTSYNVVSGIISGNAQSSLGWSAYDGTNTASYISDRVGFNASTYYVINQASTGVQLTNGSTAWAAQSDETVKDIIEPIVDAAKKVSTLRAVIGKYKKDKKETRRSFLIAQDVQKVLPEAVDLDESDNTLSLRYTEVIPLLVAAIQEQQTLINNLTTRLNALEGK